MPLFLVERTFAQELAMEPDELRLIGEIEEEEDVDWLSSFLSADRRTSYCLYEAPSADAVLAAAARAGLPVDAITEVRRAHPGDPSALRG